MTSTMMMMMTMTMMMAMVTMMMMMTTTMGRLGLGPARVDAVLPGGRLLSEALAETVAGAFGPAWQLQHTSC